MKKILLILAVLILNKTIVNGQNILLDTTNCLVSDYGWNKGDKIPNIKL